MEFINREKDLKFLNNKWSEKGADFIIIYGKRRVGKTELIKQFIKNKKGVYFLADKRSQREQLRELGRIIGEYFDDSLLIKNGFSEWLEVFEYLKKNIKSKFILAIDEYPYLVEADKSISSIFQKGWDEYLKDKNIFLILSGSSIAMMESEALLYKSPLYGRRTGQILLKPLSFQETRQFLPRLNFEESLRFYTITGGIPAYILQIEPTFSFQKNLKQRVLLKSEFLFNEIEFILKEELREPKNYLSILKAISWGKRKFGEIVNETGMQKNILTKYLQTLEKLQLIEKEVPVTEKNPQKSRKGLYRIHDNFFRFWFQYIFPYKSDLEIERFDEIIRKIKESFPLLEAMVYERVCQETLWSLRDKLFAFERVGRWWEKGKEIDVVGLNQRTKEIIFGEAKWSEKKVGTNIFYDLKKKASSVQWNRGERKEYFILFSKSGYTKNMKILSEKEKVFLVQKMEKYPKS